MIDSKSIRVGTAGSLLLYMLLGGFLSLAVHAQQAGPHARQLAEYGNYQLNPETVRDPGPIRDLDLSLREPSHIVFGYHPYWNGTAYQNYNWDLISHVAWFGLTMNASGNIANANSWPWTNLVNTAHGEGVKVIVTVTLFDNSDIASLLASATARQNAIDNLIARVNAGNADGVNIDFEFVPSGSQANFNTFIHDLSTAFHDQIPNSEVSIAMPAVDWWNSYDYAYLAENCDGLMIMAYGYYYGGSANAGPISPLNSGFSSWYIRRTIEDYLDETIDGSKLILGLPWYGISWPVSNSSMGAPTTGNGSSIFYSSAEPAAQSFGKHYNTAAPAAWYNDNSGALHQTWYDDSTSLAAKYNYAKAEELLGVGIWALGYDGGRSEIWGGLADAFGATAPPITPQWFITRGLDNGSIQVQIAPTSFTEGYEVLAGTDVTQLTSQVISPVPEVELLDLPQDVVVYLQVRASNAFGSSPPSEILAVVNGGSGPRVLIVQGFERSSGTNNSFDFVKRHGPAIWEAGYGFDAASNDAVADGVISLPEYAIVDWISGEEATATVSFDAGEQQVIQEFLEGGGRLLVSGSEIGWDLEANGTPGDINFYHDYLKADYVSDDAGSYSCYGLAAGIFQGLEDLDFDDGNHGSYDVDYPDGIKPFGGSSSNLRYTNVDYAAVGGAGVQYAGPFGESSIPGRIIYLGVGFEAFYPESSRNAIMARILTFLSESLSVEEGQPRVPLGFKLGQAYPNPFNAAVLIPLHLGQASLIRMDVFDVRGRRVATMTRDYPPGDHMLTWRPEGESDLASGVYLLKVGNGTGEETRRVMLVK